MASFFKSIQVYVSYNHDILLNLVRVHTTKAHKAAMFSQNSSYAHTYTCTVYRLVYLGRFFLLCIDDKYIVGHDKLSVTSGFFFIGKLIGEVVNRGFLHHNTSQRSKNRSRSAHVFQKDKHLA